jgi:5-methylcytosine-specific restriction endonuclease McrA
MSASPRFTIEQSAIIAAKISKKLMGHIVSEETRAKIATANMGKNKGRPKPEGFGAKISALWRGKPKASSTKEKLSRAHMGKLVSDETKAKMSIAHMGKIHTEEWRREAAERVTGKKNHNWQGGVTPMRVTMRKGLDYALWRIKVYDRDEYTCQKCNEVGGILKAHHMDSFADFPEYRLDVENGVTLCHECHREFHHRYGTHHNRKWQTIEFLDEVAKA